MPELIRSMPAKSSPMDKILTTVIKKCADAFAPLLSRLMTLSFNEGNFQTHTSKRFSRFH
jgi:hypothetical protein